MGRSGYRWVKRPQHSPALPRVPSGRGRSGGFRRGWLQLRRFLGQLQPGIPHEFCHGCGIQARSVVFNPQRPGALVEIHMPDSVDVARTAQCRGHLLGGRSGVAKEDLYRRHISRIAVREIRCRTLAAPVPLQPLHQFHHRRIPAAGRTADGRLVRSRPLHLKAGHNTSPIQPLHLHLKGQ
jgi:hypothetical protein